MRRFSRPDARRALARRARLLLVALVALAGSGCAALFEGVDTAPNGLSTADDELRRLLARGAYDSAYVRVRSDPESAPRDALLRAMYGGIVAYYAADYDGSIRALDEAERIAQDRITKSVSRGGLSALTNDRILPYEAGPSERLLIHYYGMMAGIAGGQPETAAVEARRLSHLLDQIEETADTSSASERTRLRALLHYVSGVVFEAAGARTDADVSYRRAGRLVSSLSGPAAPPPPDSGDVVVLVEQGFVSHLAEETVWILLSPDEVELFSGGDAAEKLALAGLVAAQVASELAARSSLRERHHSDDRPARRRVRTGLDGRGYGDRLGSHDDDGPLPYLLEVAWPVLRQSRGTPLGTPLVALGADSGATTLPMAFHTDVSDAYAADYAGERAAILGRTVLRAVARFAIGKAAEAEVEEKDELMSKVVGVLFDAGSVALERADTRSWHLLPGDIGVLRARLPAGRYPVSVRLENGREIMLGTAQVEGGKVVVLTGRLW